MGKALPHIFTYLLCPLHVHTQNASGEQDNPGEAKLQGMLDHAQHLAAVGRKGLLLQGTIPE